MVVLLKSQIVSLGETFQNGCQRTEKPLQLFHIKVRVTVWHGCDRLCNSEYITITGMNRRFHHLRIAGEMAIFQQQGWNNPADPYVEKQLCIPRRKGFLREKDLCSAASAFFYSSACCTAGSHPRTGCSCTRPTLSNDPGVGCQTFRRLQPLRSGEIRIAVG